MRVGTYDAAEECSEQCLRWKVVAHFFEAKQYAANRSAEGNSYSTGSTGTENLPALAVVIAILGKDTTSNVSNAGRDMYLVTVSLRRRDGLHTTHVGSFFTKTKARCNTEDQSEGLDDERAQTEVSVEHKTTQDDFDFSNSTARSRVVDHGWPD